jgi:hypothetical protein
MLSTLRTWRRCVAKGKLGTMESELVTFSDLNMVKVKAADTKRKLEAASVRYRRQKDTTRTCVSSLANKAEARKQQLHENELYGALEKLEIKMRSMEQSIFQMTVRVAAGLVVGAVGRWPLP